MEPHPSEPENTSTDSAFTKPPRAEREREVTKAYAPSPKPYLVYFSVGIALVILLCAGIAFLSARSTPGTTLYPVQTQIAERVFTVFRFTNAARAAYTTTLLERRLEDLRVLAAETGTTTPETLAAVTSLMESHAYSAAAYILDSSLSNEDRITALAHLSQILRAEEILVADTEKFSPAEGQMDTAADTIKTSLKNAVATFASSSDPEAVNTYLSTQITEVGVALQHVAQGSRAQTLALKRLSETEDALTEGKSGDAIFSILKAKEAFAVDAYLWDSERGPTADTPTEPLPIPEGS